MRCVVRACLCKECSGCRAPRLQPPTAGSARFRPRPLEAPQERQPNSGVRRGSAVAACRPGRRRHPFQAGGMPIPWDGLEPAAATMEASGLRFAAASPRWIEHQHHGLSQNSSTCPLSPDGRLNSPKSGGLRRRGDSLPATAGRLSRPENGDRHHLIGGELVDPRPRAVVLRSRPHRTRCRCTPEEEWALLRTSCSRFSEQQQGDPGQAEQNVASPCRCRFNNRSARVSKPPSAPTRPGRGPLRQLQRCLSSQNHRGSREHKSEAAAPEEMSV